MSDNEPILGYWDGESPMVFCHIDSEDRFYFSDKVITGSIDFYVTENGIETDNTGHSDSNETENTGEIGGTPQFDEKYRKGCDFFCNCKTRGPFNELFLVKKSDGGLYYNGSIVFTKNELDQFKKRDDEDSEIDASDCSCPVHKNLQAWQIKFPKRLWLLGFVQPTLSESIDLDNGDIDNKLISKPDGIEFNTGDEIVHVGRDGAWVCLYVPDGDHVT